MNWTSTVARVARRRTTPLASALALTLMTGFTSSVSATSYNPILNLSAALPKVALANTLMPSPAEGPAYYTIVFKEAPLATYAGEVANLRAPDSVVRNGMPIAKIDVNSAPARAYVSYLETRQQAFVDDLSSSLRRPLDVRARMQHALNAVIVRLDGTEAAQVMKRPDVLFIEREHQLELSTDRGPEFIGAPSIWNGLTATGVATEGEGILFGDIDTGINWESPAFAGVGPIDGYVHQNPKGNGTYLGQCATGGVDAGKCNDKLIGIYNFAAAGSTGTDIDGHGSHTASTAAGNRWSAIYANGPFTISGVAPHANVISYLACLPAGCSSVATSQSANQAVVDGVDVINYSISGGTSPWTDATSTAFRNAVAAGTFVAASAGNTSTTVTDPQGQVNHMEPWVETVAASTEDRILAVSLDLTSEATPPANTQNVPMRPGGAPLPTQNLVDVPLIKSPNFANGSTDGCAAYPAGTFVRGGDPSDRIFADGFDGTLPPPLSQGAVAVLHLDGTASSCGSGARRTAALNAGAVGVIFVDAVYLNLGAADTSWSMLMTDWLNLEAGSNPATARVSIDVAAQAFPGPGDEIASFSFRGPRLVSGQGMVKPDITAPGVDILAAGSSNLVGANGVILLNGTSMSSPHMAGSGILMRALNPTWSATQVKSALNLSSNNFGAVNQGGAPVRLWDYGSGRVNLTAASKVGLIMDETSANFVAANPAIGGDISTLNLASMAKANFVGDTVFTRTFRRARSGSQTYTLSATGFPAGAIEFSPASFNISSTGSRTITVTAHGALLTASQWTLGELTLTPSAGDEPNLHLPIALNPAGPIINVTPAALSGSSDETVSNDLTIANVGNPTLNWSVLSAGTAQVTPLNTTTSNNGQLGGYYVADSEGDYISQNFDTSGATHVTAMRANGFVLPSGSLTAANTPSITFSVYADNAGEPSGAPEGFGSAPLWTYSNTIGAANGITTTAGNLQLNLAAAGVPALDLPAGRHWMTVYPTITPSSSTLLWAWRTSPDATIGNAPVVYEPYFDNTQFLGFTGVTAMSAIVQGTVDCSLPSWVHLTTTSGSLGFAGSQTVPVVFDAAGLSAGTYTATMCIASNATNTATVTVPLTFTVPNGGSQAPTLSKAFAPTSIDTSMKSTLTITLNNAGPAASTLSANLTDTFPSGLVVAAVPAESTTCPSGTVTAVAGSGSVSLATGAQIPAVGSCTVSVDVTSASAGSYNNSIAAGALQTSSGTNAGSANATLTVTAVPLVAPTSVVAFTPTSVTAGTPSTLTITLGNTNAVAANLTAALDDNLPAGLLVAPTPNAASSCVSGTVTASAGTSLVKLASGAQIPASGNCTVTVDVRAVSAGTFTNTIPAGALQTDAGNSTAAGSDVLTVTAGTFPAPYCPRLFTDAVEPITLVNIDGINNATSATVGGTPALENFLSVIGTLVPGASYNLRAKGNSDGSFTNVYRAYFDWNQDGVFSETAAERYELGSITSSTGVDTKETSAVLTVPMNAVVGSTRMRIVKKYSAAGSACGGDDASGTSYGQAEDYTVTIDPNGTLPPAIITFSKAFSPTNADVSSTSTLVLNLGQLNGAGPATLTAALTDTLPAGLVVAATPNASTTCPSGTVTAVAGSGSVSLAIGAQIPAAGCTVSADMSAAVAGIYVNTIAANSLKTDLGNYAAAVTANYQATSPGVATYSTGFEAPFTAANLGGQQSWGLASGSTAADWKVSILHPDTGTQHARATWTSTSGTSTTILSPTFASGTTTYSSATARLSITYASSGAGVNGTPFDFTPQDPGAGSIVSRVRFMNNAAKDIMVLDPGTGTYVATGSSWTPATYFTIKVVTARATKNIEVCLNGASIYTGAGYASNTTNVAFSGTKGATTPNNILDIDNFVLDNSNTGGCP